MGLWHMRSGTHHFLTPDPFAGFQAYPATLNKYLYALNDPLVLSDPTGLNPLDTFFQAYRDFTGSRVGVVAKGVLELAAGGLAMVGGAAQLAAAPVTGITAATGTATLAAGGVAIAQGALNIARGLTGQQAVDVAEEISKGAIGSPVPAQGLQTAKAIYGHDPLTVLDNLSKWWTDPEVKQAGGLFRYIFFFPITAESATRNRK